MSGAPYIVGESGIRNQYMVRVINKSDTAKTFSVSATADDGRPIALSGNDALAVPAMGEEVRPLVVSVARQDYTGEFDLSIELTGPEGRSIVRRSANFLGPDPRLIQP